MPPTHIWIIENCLNINDSPSIIITNYNINLTDMLMSITLFQFTCHSYYTYNAIQVTVLQENAQQ